MTDILSTAQRVCEFLEARGVPAALVGGLAVSARTEPRFTRDVDIVVVVDDDSEAEELLHAMRGVGYVPIDLVEQEATDRLATARCARPEDPEGIVVDLLFSSSGIEPEIAAEAELLEVAEGIRVRVAKATHLLAMKILSKKPERPQDVVDIQALFQAIPETEHQKVLELLELIERRGHDRGKSLREEFQSVVDELDDASSKG